MILLCYIVNNSSLRRAFSLLSLLLWTACAPTPEPEDFDPIAQSIRDLSGARTRVVWLKDAGDGADYIARGTNLILMAYDTDDSRGERELLSAGRNMVKPMFTVDGDRVLFSDRHNGTMHLVDWKGDAAETLGEGFALHTWRDPKSGIEWLYFARGAVEQQDYLPNYSAMYRRPLPPYPRNVRTLMQRWRGRLSEQLVWDQTEVSEDSYQLSADGRFASAAFPWPNVGVHDIAPNRWLRHGQGCWVGMSPDNSYLFWILDGPHRNLIMERVGGPQPERWPVNINSLPDTARYEVYHPRWSNHPRIMAVTGPYTSGDGKYRLAGGGADVKVWLGRFDQSHRSIEHWVQVSWNDAANFYPDVWVEPARDTTFAEGADIEQIHAATPSTWPSDRTGLIYLWEHAAAQNEIRLPDTDRRRLFRPDARGHARVGPRHTLWVTDGYFMDRDSPALPTTFTIEWQLAPDETFSESDQFVFGPAPQRGLWIRDQQWVWQWDDKAYSLGPFEDTPRQHLAVRRTSSELALFANGVAHGTAMLSRPHPDSLAAPLYIGGHPEVERGLDGFLSHIAIYNRALDERELAINQQLSRRYLNQFSVPEPTEIQARVVALAGVPTPEEIAPYRRALVFNTYEIEEGERAGERLMAAHWVILNAQILPTARRELGSVYTLRIAPFMDHPELEGERISLDEDDFLLEQYYDLNL